MQFIYGEYYNKTKDISSFFLFLQGYISYSKKMNENEEKKEQKRKKNERKRKKKMNENEQKNERKRKQNYVFDIDEKLCAHQFARR